MKPRLHCYLTQERQRKSRGLMLPMAQGAQPAGWDAKVVPGEFLPHGTLHLVWGQIWKAARIVPAAAELGELCAVMDNGWFLPGVGRSGGFYRLTFSPGPLPPGTLPAELCDRRPADLGVEMRPWRRDGRHVLIAMPGPHFGTPWGLNMQPWIDTVEERVRAATGRPVRVRYKGAPHALEEDLLDCWAVVTHSSNVAVDAVLAGVPVFVEPTSPAAPVGNLSLDRLDRPECPPRSEWLRSLLAQQFSLDDMREGRAYRFLDAIRGGILQADPARSPGHVLHIRPEPAAAAGSAAIPAG